MKIEEEMKFLGIFITIYLRDSHFTLKDQMTNLPLLPGTHWVFQSNET